MTSITIWRRLQTYPYLSLFVVWVIATLINLDKAFHIDDTFHLEAAKWIQKNPFKPMSGLINWYDIEEPIHHFNQPPLYFYLIAAFGSIFSYSEIPLHLFQSIFSGLSIVYFYKLVRLINPNFALTATLLLALGPAFLVNQNLMADIPILALSIMFMYFLTKTDGKDHYSNIYIAAIILSVGLLIKYSLLPLTVVLCFRIWQSKRLSLVPALLIPVIILAGWTIFNYYEFGGSHIFGRPRNNISLSLLVDNLTTFLMTLGAIVPFTLLYLNAFLKKENKTTKLIVFYSTVTATLLCYVFVYGFISNSILYDLFWLVFLSNGILLSIITIYFFKGVCKNPLAILIALWGLGMGSFIILLAPFMATRHVLLVIPPILLLGSYIFQNVSIKAANLSLLLTLFIGGVLSISDWHYADFYRHAATKALSSIPTGSRGWSVGHWGWQWYSKQAGMQFYSIEKSDLRNEDYIIGPAFSSKQKILDNAELYQVGTIVYPPTIWNRFTTANYARFYNSFPKKIPWYITLSPADSIVIYKVGEPTELDTHKKR